MAAVEAKAKAKRHEDEDHVAEHSCLKSIQNTKPAIVVG